MSLWSLVMLEAELPTPATVDSEWWDHPLVPASLMEAGLVHNQFVIVRIPYSIVVISLEVVC